MQDHHFRACTCRDVSELKGDESAADEHHAIGKRGQVEELVAADNELAARKRQRLRAGSRRNHHVAALELLFAYGDRCRAGEACVSVEDVDPRIAETAFLSFWIGIGE